MLLRGTHRIKVPIHFGQSMIHAHIGRLTVRASVNLGGNNGNSGRKRS
jgi:hypothetical protein